MKNINFGKMRILILLFCVFSLAGNAQDLNRGLMAYYDFSKGCNDQSGHGNTGYTEGSAVILDDEGAALFPGLKQPGCIHVHNSSSLKVSSQWSVSVDFCLVSTQLMDGYGRTSNEGAGCIFAKSTDKNGIAAHVSPSSNKLSIEIGTWGIEWASATLNTSNYLNKYINVVFTYDNGIVKIYINGELKTSKKITFNFNSANNNDLYIGKYSNVWFPFAGKIDNFRWYNRVLNASDVSALANSSSAGSVANSNIASASDNTVKPTTQIANNEDLNSGLMAYYDFSKGCNDQSGHGNTGYTEGSAVILDDEGAALFPGLKQPGCIHVHNSSSLKVSSQWSVSVDFCLVSTQLMDGYGRTSNEGAGCIFAKSTDRNGIAAHVSPSNNKLSIEIGTWGTEWASATLNTSNYLNKYINVVFTYDNGIVKIYINGELKTNKKITFNFNSANNNDLYIGKYSNVWFPFAGKIDNFRWYNRVLSASDVSVLANSSPAGSVASSNIASAFDNTANTTTQTSNNVSSAATTSTATSNNTTQNDNNRKVSSSEMAAVMLWNIVGEVASSVKEALDSRGSYSSSSDSYSSSNAAAAANPKLGDYVQLEVVFDCGIMCTTPLFLIKGKVIDENRAVNRITIEVSSVSGVREPRRPYDNEDWEIANKNKEISIYLNSDEGGIPVNTYQNLTILKRY